MRGRTRAYARSRGSPGTGKRATSSRTSARIRSWTAASSRSLDRLDDPAADAAHLVGAHAPGRRGRRPDADPGGDVGRVLVERDRVLVDGDPDVVEQRLGVAPGHAERRHVDQREVVVGAARHDPRAGAGEGRREHLGVLDGPRLVPPELVRSGRAGARPPWPRRRASAGRPGCPGRRSCRPPGRGCPCRSPGSRPGRRRPGGPGGRTPRRPAGRAGSCGSWSSRGRRAGTGWGGGPRRRARRRAPCRRTAAPRRRGRSRPAARSPRCAGRRTRRRRPPSAAPRRRCPRSRRSPGARCPCPRRTRGPRTACPEKLTGDPWVRCPPWARFMPRIRSPGLSTAK